MFQQIAIVLAAGAALAACGASQNPLRVTLSACPAVAVLANASDVTLFAPPTSRDASAIDVVATITNVRGSCSEAGNEIVTNASYDVVARRTDATAARSVTLPVFAAVMQAGDQLVAKQVGAVTLNFAAGQARAQASGVAQSRISRAAATLPPEIRAKIERKRKPGDPDAAIDPLADPEVRGAVRGRSFELLLGFQLDEAGLAYNVTK